MDKIYGILIYHKSGGATAVTNDEGYILTFDTLQEADTEANLREAVESGLELVVVCLSPVRE